jgi:hypothetical protein
VTDTRNKEGGAPACRRRYDVGGWTQLCWSEMSGFLGSFLPPSVYSPLSCSVVMDAQIRRYGRRNASHGRCRSFCTPGDCVACRCETRSDWLWALSLSVRHQDLLDVPFTSAFLFSSVFFSFSCSYWICVDSEEWAVETCRLCNLRSACGSSLSLSLCFVLSIWTSSFFLFSSLLFLFCLALPLLPLCFPCHRH